MPEYLDFPVETDPDALAASAFDDFAARAPGWLPNAGNVETWLLEAFARIAAEVRDVASRVPVSVFRRMGVLVGVLPIDATAATVATTWTAINNAGYTIPAGTRAGIRTAGDTLVAFATVADAVIPALSTSITGVTMAAVDAGADGSGIGTGGGALELIDRLDYVASVTQAAATSGGVDAEDDTVYLNRLRSELQLLAPRPILPADFAALAQSVAGIDRALAIDGYNPLHNLLTANEASAETDASGWTNATNTTVASSAAQAADGAKSVSMTAVASVDMSMRLAASKTVTPGDVITVLGSFRAFGSSLNCRVGIEWRDAGDAVLSTVYGAYVADANSGWIVATHTAAAPALAVKARLIAFVQAPVAANVHYFDKASMRRGAGTDWVPGGTAETGNERMLTVGVVDENGNAPSSGALALLAAQLDAQREITFIVSAAGPTYTQVDVAFTFTTYPGYDPVDVKARAEQAVRDFLSPANWGRPLSGDVRVWLNQPTVNRLDVATVINNVQGVDKVTALTLGLHLATLAAADVPLAGAAPMPSPQTITGTAA